MVSGCDMIGPISATGINYNDIYSLVLNPLAITGSRVSIESQLWLKFRFSRVTLRYDPTCPSSTSGQLLLSHIADPEVILPATKTLGYAQALAAVPGANAGSIWLEQKHDFAPSKEDPKEYYISPDAQGETRLTIQGVLKVCEALASSNTTSAAGMLYLEYDLMFYDPIIAVNQIVSWTPIPCVAGSAYQAGSIVLYDQGGYASLQAYPTAPIPVSSVVAFYLSAPYAYAKAFQVYYLRTSAAISTLAIVYATLRDCASASGANQVAGTFAGGAPLIPNTTLYFALVPTPEDG